MHRLGGVAHARRSQRGSLASKSSRDAGKKILILFIHNVFVTCLFNNLFPFRAISPIECGSFQSEWQYKEHQSH